MEIIRNSRGVSSSSQESSSEEEAGEGGGHGAKSITDGARKMQRAETGNFRRSLLS